MPHLFKQDCVTEMDIGRGRIKARLDPERPVFRARFFKLFKEVGLNDNFDGAPLYDFKLLFGFQHRQYNRTLMEYTSIAKILL
jgi:hypothetical protein